MWDLVPLPGIKPTPPALEGKVLTTRTPEKSQAIILNIYGFRKFFEHKGGVSG